MSSDLTAVAQSKPINRIGAIDGHCRECYESPTIVYAGPPEAYPHGAEVVCTACGYRRKANLTEIRSARANTDPGPVNESSYLKLTLFADDVLRALGIHGEIFDDGEAAIDQIRDLKSAQYTIQAERDRIRAKLIKWLIGDLDDIGRKYREINGRRIVDEIDRICPKE